MVVRKPFQYKCSKFILTSKQTTRPFSFEEVWKTGPHVGKGPSKGHRGAPVPSPRRPNDRQTLLKICCYNAGGKNVVNSALTMKFQRIYSYRNRLP